VTGLQNGNLRWSRYAAEVVTIVVGILLALGADAGRQYLVDRQSEREILAALRIEFAADVSEITRDQEKRSEKLAGIDLLRDVRAGAVASTSPKALADALLQTLDYRFYTASHPVLDDLLQTGRLELIRSNELRYALMIFGQRRSRIGVVEQRERDFVADQFEPYVGAKLDLEALASGSPDKVAAALNDISGMLPERNFGSLLYLNRDHTNLSLAYGEELLAAVTEVQQVLDR
jgi:hypothetical protein